MMILTPRGFAAFVLIASASVLGSAYASQYWGGLAPCELCLLQRWPWAAAFAVAVIALAVANRPALPWVALGLALIYALGAAFAFYHIGVEEHWFAGPSACTAGGGGALTLDEMKRQILGTAPVLCDRVQWSLFGVSMAGWNFLASLGMATICIAAFVRTRHPLSPETATA